MSKKISFRGSLPIGEVDQIRLKTNTGKTGYKITKFQTINRNVGNTTSGECSVITKITLTDPTGSVGATVDFTDSDLLATAYYEYNSGSSVNTMPTIIIFDNKLVNQDIFVSCADARGATDPINYYIELETMSLSDLEATKLTLQNIRTVTAPAGNV